MTRAVRARPNTASGCTGCSTGAWRRRTTASRPTTTPPAPCTGASNARKTSTGRGCRPCPERGPRLDVPGQLELRQALFGCGLAFGPEAPGGDAAIDDKRVAGDKAGGIAGEPGRSLGDIAGEAGPLDRLALGEAHLHEIDREVGLLGLQAHALAEDGGCDAARADGVDP